jgi:hypothetical protein
LRLSLVVIAMLISGFQVAVVEIGNQKLKR